MSMLGQNLTPGTIEQMSSQIGATPQQTQNGIAAALPALLGGLAHNATRSPQGAQDLDNALTKNHDGGLLDQLGGLMGGAGGGGGAGGALGALGGLMGGGGGGGLGGLLGGLLGGGSGATNGAGILGHVLGGRQPAIEQGVSRASGLGGRQSAQLLMMLAPLVMSALGKLKREKNLDANGVANVLETEEEQLTAPVPGVNKGGIAGLFDRDNDGSIADDLAKIGAAVGGAFLLSKMGGRRR